MVLGSSPSAPSKTIKDLGEFRGYGRRRRGNIEATFLRSGEPVAIAVGMPRNGGRKLFVITGPDRIQSTIIGADPLAALHQFHGEGFGWNAVGIRDGRLWFKRRADQALVAGTWRIVEQGINDGSPATLIEIEPPD